MIASAAYWLASQLDQIFVTESSRLGSIGVYVEHDDISAMLEQVGVKVTLIAYGEHKVDGNMFEPLSDAARAKIQADVNRSGEKFTLAVGRGRGVGKSVVLDTFGQGQMFDGDQSIALGMADKIGAFDQVIARASKGKTTRATVDERTIFVLGELPEVQPRAETSDDAPADIVDPDGDGNCQDGYEKGDDGMCHLIAPDDQEARARARADADLTSTAVAVTSARG
jgi:ClpP class serine protease